MPQYTPKSSTTSTIDVKNVINALQQLYSREITLYMYQKNPPFSKCFTIASRHLPDADIMTSLMSGSLSLYPLLPINSF